MAKRRMVMKDHDARRKLSIAERYNYTCIVCGRPFDNVACITIEHIVPKSMGGKGGDNLAASHYNCNRLRGTMSLLDAAMTVEKKLRRLGTMAHDWLNKQPPNRDVPAAALLPPVDAWWFFWGHTFYVKPTQNDSQS